MFSEAFKGLDKTKWLDRMHPQTLAIATWLLYIDGVFATLSYLDGEGVNLYLTRFSLGGFLSLLACIGYIGSGFLMANGKKLGWFIALAASFSPFILRFYMYLTYPEVNISLSWVLDGGSLVNFVFEAAVCALLLHGMTRTYVNRWLR